MTAVGHFLSWASEYGLLFAGFIITFAIEKSELSVDTSELIGLYYPSTNLVIFPLVQLLLSDVLRAEVRDIFRLMKKSLVISDLCS